MSKFSYALLVGAAVILSSTSARAQVREGDSPRSTNRAGNLPGAVAATRSVQADSVHAYDQQALRFETSWGNVRIMRGSEGALVGTAGWFRDPGIEKLLASSPRALTEARAYETNNFRGSLVGGAGALAAVVGVVVAANGSNDASSPMLVIAGVSGMIWGAQHLSMSYSALSRAFWWYNRDLQR